MAEPLSSGVQHWADWSDSFGFRPRAGQAMEHFESIAERLFRESLSLFSDLNATAEFICRQALYASSLFFILTIILVKISIILFLRTLAPIRALRRTGDALGAVFLMWGLASFLATAFQCSVPNVWHWTGGTCFNIVSFPKTGK